jgi:hypothetical protein
VLGKKLEAAVGTVLGTCDSATEGCDEAAGGLFDDGAVLGFADVAGLLGNDGITGRD